MTNLNCQEGLGLAEELAGNLWDQVSGPKPETPKPPNPGLNPKPLNPRTETLNP